MSVLQVFNIGNFKSICDKLARRDKDLKMIIERFGYPPCWKRTAGFETLVYIILEQQVSLASAKAAYLKLKSKISPISPQNLLLLNDDDLKKCYFSRQKMAYARHLATAIINKQLDLDSFAGMNNDEIRATMLQIKGLGNWTVDVYLMMAMHRADLFPLGDIALIKSIKATKHLPINISREEIQQTAEKWKPYQTIAAYILWHAYLNRSEKMLSQNPHKNYNDANEP